ncbi:cobyrinic acid a,c-diamide synthase, partial [Streptomyces niveus]
MAGSPHCEPEVEESESLRSDANIAGPMTDPVPGPRSESSGGAVFKGKNPPPQGDTPPRPA